MNHLQKNKRVLSETFSGSSNTSYVGAMTANKGFTLIELIVTITIAAVVLAIAVPSFQAIIEKNRISSEADRLFSSLKQARNNAIVTGSPTFLCRVNGGVDLNNIACSVNVNGDATDWSGDFLIYTGLLTPTPTVIPNGNGSVLIEDLSTNNGNRDQMLQAIADAPNNGVRIAAGGTQPVIRFEPDGTVQIVDAGGTVAANVTARFTVCDPRLAVPEQNGRIIVVNEVGVVRSFSADPDDANRLCL